MQRRKDFNARLKKIRAKEDAARKRAEGDEPPFKRLVCENNILDHAEVLNFPENHPFETKRRRWRGTLSA